MSQLRPIRTLLLLTTLGLLSLSPAQADGGRALPKAVPAAYIQECGACHVGFAPSLLPASSWQRLMQGLDKHFGSDASIDAATRQTLTRWLTDNAATYRRVSVEPPQDRITRSPWFERKHRKIDASVWRLDSVKSAAHCTACHTDAEQGRFDERALRYPAGLDARARRNWND